MNEKNVVTIAWQVEKHYKYFDIKAIAVDERGTLQNLPQWKCSGYTSFESPSEKLSTWIMDVATRQLPLMKIQIVPDENYPELKKGVLERINVGVINLENLAKAAESNLQNAKDADVVNLKDFVDTLTIKKALTNARLAIWFQAAIAKEAISF